MKKKLNFPDGELYTEKNEKNTNMTIFHQIIRSGNRKQTKQTEI